MKHLRLLAACIVIPAAVLGILMLILYGSERPAEFDVESEGIIQIQTLETCGDGDKTEYYVIADKNRCKPCDAFEADTAVVYDVPSGCFESYIDREKRKVLNRLVRVALRKDGKYITELPAVMRDLFERIAGLEHDLLTVKIMDISGEYFVYVELNVNWWSPCDLYWYDQENSELVLMCEFDDKETVGIHIISPDRLRKL